VADAVVIEPMTEELLLWRCLHGGPLSRGTLDGWPADSKMPWERYRRRNIPFLKRIMETYGSCAILARSGDRIVGQLRFYPKVLPGRLGSIGICLQQDFPAGPPDDVAGIAFPSMADIKDRTLTIHCMMTGSPQQAENPFQRRGIGSRMVRCLIQWAKAMGWESIEADAFEDIPIIYEITGSAGRTFWEKLGFHQVDRHPHPELKKGDPFAVTLCEQAKAMGIPCEKAMDRIVMRFDLQH
jgi:RimJ/RimL family protein N-acetyltransferase